MGSPLFPNHILNYMGDLHIFSIYPYKIYTNSKKKQSPQDLNPSAVAPRGCATWRAPHRRRPAPWPPPPPRGRAARGWRGGPRWSATNGAGWPVPQKITIMYFLGLKLKSYHNSIQTQQLNTKEIEDTPNNTWYDKIWNRKWNRLRKTENETTKKLNKDTNNNSIQTQQFNTKQIEDTNQNQPKNQGMRQRNKRTKQNQEMTRQNQKNQDMEQEMKQVKKQ